MSSRNYHGADPTHSSEQKIVEKVNEIKIKYAFKIA